MCPVCQRDNCVVHRQPPSVEAMLAQVEAMMPGPTAPDPVAVYGAPIWDGEHWIRHFIDKPGWSVETLCGMALPADWREHRYESVWRTCERCAERQTEMKSWR